APLSAPLPAQALTDARLPKNRKFLDPPHPDAPSPDTRPGTFRYHWYFILIFVGSIAAGFVYGHSHPAMVIWATFALLITAAPMFAWRHGMRQDRKKPGAHAGGRQPDAAEAPRTQELPQQYPAQQHAPHQPQARPSWAGSHGAPGGSGGPEGPGGPGGGNPGNDQTMQIALGGLGGRKE
ncbi:glycosyl transferase, partial [Streptomyces sp. NPDC056290]